MTKHQRHRSSGVMASTQQPLAVKVKRILNPSVMSVPCPECQAGTGQPCTWSTGRSAANQEGHISRKRMAARKMLEEKAAE